ncbi:MAG: glycosyl hydrolase [Planctomycetota bacterium]
MTVRPTSPRAPHAARAALVLAALVWLPTATAPAAVAPAGPQARPQAAPAPPATDPARLGAWRELGPTTFGGRIVDLATHPDHPGHLWVASPSGGLWLTENHGTTWRCIFERERAFSIGDIAVDPRDTNVVWVGSGEANNQRSSYWGDGVYKTTDGGATWANMGLTDSHHIGRVVIDPVDSNKVFVAALGHLYTTNEERGLYRTLDGGATWERVLFVDERTGVVDVVVDPADPRFVYAATYERLRRAWDLDESGPGSGIWRSTDGGATFARCAGGLPEGELGRIGLDVFAGDPRTLYATVSNMNRVAVDRGPVNGLTTEFKDGQLVVRSVEEKSGAAELGLQAGDVLVKLGDEALDTPFGWVKVLARFEASAKEQDTGASDEAEQAEDEATLTLVRRRGADESTLELTLSKLFAVDVKEPELREVGGEVYRSDDRGETWRKVNKKPAGGDPPYYYGQIRVDPTDVQRVYMCSVPLLASTDGGETWSNIASSVHTDHHALVIDPQNPDKLILGNDGGLHISWDRGDTWFHQANLPLAQFYTVTVDRSEPFRVYGGTQDNGSWGGPNTSRDPKGIHPSEWFNVGGGDGFYTVTDWRDLDTVYGESQFGAIYRRDLRTGATVNIWPQVKGESLRFNWSSPILISYHNPEIIYFGANRLFKSLDRGDNWLIYSPDLTTNDAVKLEGNVPHCTITTVAESRLDPGLVLVGTDDGNVQLTQDGCYTWTNLTGAFPGALPNGWVSRVELSQHARGRAYVAFTGYREDEFRPMLYATDELGAGRAWRDLAAGLPAGEPVNVVREDPRNPDMLYVGTEFGVHVSWDRGETWRKLGEGLPTLPVHDLALHDRDGVLVAGTHGRGFWALDVNAVRGMNAERAAQATLLPVGDVTRWERRRAVGGYGGGDGVRYGENARQVAHLAVHLPSAIEEGVELALSIEDAAGKELAKFDLLRDPGTQAFTWDLRAEAQGEARGRRGARGRGAEPGEYTAVLKVGAGKPQRQKFSIRADALTAGR